MKYNEINLELKGGMIVDAFEKLYTVEDIATMAGLTSRTIRNYLKDGSLKGKKIGGQWRFTMKDIEQLFDNGGFSKELKNNNRQDVMDFIDGVMADFQGPIQLCTIADYYCGSMLDAKKMCDTLIAVINNPENKFPKAKFNYEYIESDGKARFTLFGTPDYICKVLELLK
jgi:excisionase family DNA binding protein